MTVGNKIKCCALALCLCLMATAAQAALEKDASKVIKTVGVITKGRMGVKFPNGRFFEIPVSNQKITKIPGVKVGQEDIGDLFDGFSSQIRPPSDRNVATEQDWQQFLETPQITNTMEGISFVRPTSYRKIEIPYASAVRPNGVDLEAVSAHFDGVPSAKLLDDVFPVELLEQDPYALAFHDALLQAYELVATGQSNFWNLDDLQTSISLKAYQEGFVSKETANDLFFINDKRYEMIPELVPVISVLSFTEFQVTYNGGYFPTFGLDTVLNYHVMGLWRRLVGHELPSKVSQFLLKDYLYATDAQNVQEILDESLQFLQENNRWPGVEFFSYSREDAILVLDDVYDGKIQLSEKLLEEFELGQKLLLLTHVMPDSPYWGDLTPKQQELILQIKKSIEEEVAYHRAD